MVDENRCWKGGLAHGQRKLAAWESRDQPGGQISAAREFLSSCRGRRREGLATNFSEIQKILLANGPKSVH